MRRLILAFLMMVAMTGLVDAPGVASAHPQEAYPLVLDAVPSQLSVTVYAHELPDKKHSPAWTFVTDGLKKFGQAELALTVQKRHEDEPPTKDALAFFKSIFWLARQGKFVTAASRTVFGADQPLLAPQFRGAIYAPAQAFSAAPVPADSLAVIAVTPEELQAYEMGGPSRVLGRLCKLTSYYPYPTWCDGDRTSVFSAADISVMEKDPAGHSPRAYLLGCSTMATARALRLLVPPHQQDEFSQTLANLPGGRSIMICLGVDPQANAFLVWSPEKPEAVSTPDGDGSRISGDFITIIPGASKPQCMQTKDGFALILSAEQWRDLKAAAAARRQFVMDIPDSRLKRFTLDMPTEVHSIDDMHRRVIEATQALSNDNGPGSHKLPAAIMDLVVLLTPDEKLRGAIEVKPLSSFVKDIENAVVKYFAGQKHQETTYDLIVQADVQPNHKAHYRISYRPTGMPRTIVPALTERLEALKVPATKSDFAFQLRMRAWPQPPNRPQK